MKGSPAGPMPNPRGARNREARSADVGGPRLIAAIYGDLRARLRWIPSPFDPRLILRRIGAGGGQKPRSPPGVASRPITDFTTYAETARPLRVPLRLSIMKPVFAQAKAAMKRVIYAEGEDEAHLAPATQVVVEEGLGLSAG